MMTEIYQAFKRQASIPSSSADTEEPPSHIEGEHVAMKDDTKKPESNKVEEEPTRVVPILIVRPTTRLNPEVALIKSSSRPQLTDPNLKIPVPQQTALVPQREGKAIAIDDQHNIQTKLVPASKEVRLDPDAPILVPYEINGKIFQLTEEQIQAHMDKEE
ncbi:hypothetical protein Tco_0843579 [Tanacetum coccineum]|uniref:Uncharacterized protein n=1 Tax=Tanacetum coccineum TaxID=301880 RepID=A0ABQ5B614_9ASTR